MVGILRYIIISILSILCFGVSPGLCAQLVGSEDVLEQSRAAERVFGEFLGASLPFRFKYEFGGEQSGPDEGGRLVNLCEKAQEKLKKIRLMQADLKKRIEEYDGVDWDVLYGQNRLWQRAYGDLQRNAVLQQRLEIYKAIGLRGKQRQDVLARVIARCDSKDSGFGRASGQVLKARAVAVLGSADAKRKALEILDSLPKRDEIGERLYFEAELIKGYLGSDLDAMDAIAGEITGSDSRDDFELNLGVTVFELMHDKADRSVRVEKMVVKWPGVKGTLGEVILEQLSDHYRQGRLDWRLLETYSVVEVSVVLNAAQKAGAQRYKGIIEKICAIERFRTPLALYVLAEANLEIEPATAIRYYLKAAMEKGEGKGDDLKPTAMEISEFAARLAYKLYHQDSNYLDTARLAMGFYCTAAGEDPDEEIVYIYAGLLGDSGRREQSTELLEKISAGGGRFWQEARLDLIALKIEESSEDTRIEGDIPSELHEMMVAGKTSVVRTDALKLYCRVLLGGEDSAAVKVLGLLEGVSDEGDGDVSLLRGIALYKLGRYVEAVEVMSGGVEGMGCQAAGQVYLLLGKILEQMDYYQLRLDGFSAFSAKCAKLGRFCVDCAEDEWKGQVELLWAEIVLFSGDYGGVDKILEKLKEKGLGESIEWVRCRARFSMKQGNWPQAFEDWVVVRTSLEGNVQKSDKWWRAKYYELYCFVKMSDDNKSRAVHAIEILQVGGGIPEFWGEKLAELSRATVGP